MKKGIQLLVLLFVSVTSISQAQTAYYPYVLGYAAGQQVLHEGVAATDIFSVSFSGGSPFATQWVATNDLGNAFTNDLVLSGFRHNLLFVDNAFKEALFVSKGYYGDFVQLRWNLVNYANQVTGFRIYRKALGSTADSLQVANIPPSARNWDDIYAESGVMYQYTLVAEGISQFSQKYMNYIDGVGFRVPYGRISGRVTYAGGAAVPNVNVIAETTDNFAGSSMYLNGTDAYLAVSAKTINDPFFKLDTALTYQAWYLPTAPAAVGTRTLFEKQGQYKLTHTTGSIVFTAGTDNLTLNYTEKVDTFFQVIAMRTADSLKLMVMYDEATVYSSKMKAAFPSTTTANTNDITIGKSSTGQFFKGYVDEIRIWHRSFSETAILRNAGMYIEGTESGLTGYYRLNEGVGTSFYDLSRQGFAFNENHGFVSSTAAWDNLTVPATRQLAVKGITDNNGNYIISGIPYATNGSTYRFVPAFGVHSFDPTEQLLFIGPGATVHSSIDFTDVASFPVTGEVYYRGTFFPVDGVTIKIDGQTAVSSSGTPITTDVQGRFTVDVPIGQHYIELAKLGHGFENNGRFPTAPGTYFDFQQPYTFQTQFNDTTLIKVIGKVVGGPVQAAKSKGLGKTINNIGFGEIVLSTQKGYDITTAYDSSIVNNDYYMADSLVTKGTTTIVKKTTTTKVRPDHTTGEYVAYLLPEKYTVTDVTAGTYTYPSSVHSTLDLTNIHFYLTETDSVDIGSLITPLGDTIRSYRADSVQYHKNLDFIYRVNPSLSVTHKNGNTAFWDTTVVAKDGITKIVVDGTGMPITDWPIFTQRKRYDLKISVFENYINTDSANAADNVPVTDGVVEITNALSTQNARQNYQISKSGVVNYSFNAGLPNIIGDMTQSMSIIAYTGNGGSIQTNWNYTKPGYSGVFKGYIFGGLPTGNNFVTTGPNKVDMVIRDPYGSNSYAWFETGNSVTKTSSFDVLNGNSGSLGVTLQLGAEVKTFAGLGAGVIIETSANADFSIGLSHEETWVNNTTTSSTTTATQTWQTSSDPAYVGSLGDVFIGHSTNIVYGISKMLDLIPTAGGACPSCVATGITGYGVGIHKALRVNPEFGTVFQYSQNHIKNYLIPNLETIRNLYLQNSPYHTSINAVGSANYGAPNGSIVATRTFTTAPADTVLTYTGQSYSYTLNIGVGAGDNWPTTQKEFIDTVKYYNTQIAGWKGILADNEKEKLRATLLKNLSFDAGVVYSSTETYDSTQATTSTSEWTLSPSIGNELGFDVMGAGMTTIIEETYTHTETTSDGTETTNSVTFGYELSDGDAGDYFSIDVKQPKTHTGPVFAVRGGQSSCPYEDAEVTEFFAPLGTLYSEATMQIEVPSILCANPVQINVPEDQPALFQVGVGNVSQTNDDAWFMVAVDQQSNQNGAKVSLDGQSLNNGRVIFIPASTLINKVITIEKISTASPNDYTDIGIILHSVCQFDPGDDWPDIADTVKLTARFKPVCSAVELTSPSDLWLRNTNTGTNLNTVMNNYNLAHPGFDKIQFQYKASSSSAWSTDMSFYVNDSLFVVDSIAGINALRVNSLPSINYTFVMKDVQDRNYDIRAVTTCANGTTNSSVILSGIKDTKRPKVFGTPQPGDGILSPGEDVMITFDEPIEAGLLLGSNFSVRGVLNGAPLRHSAALFFNGTTDYASSQAGVNVTDKSFSVEFWVKRGDLNAGVIFDQGDIQLGFNGANQFYTKIGNQTQVTVNTYAFTDKWIHFTVSFDTQSKFLNMYAAYDGYNGIDLENINFPNAFSGSGKMYIGNDAANVNGFNGLVHDFRVWEKVIGYGESNANMVVSLNGDEIGLSGFWPMNEMKGAFATDLSRSHHAILYGAQWRVFPSGYARVFDGASYLSLPTASSVVVTDQMDFTLEFWFKAAPQTNTVLFSNGRTDTTESAAALRNIWEIGIDSVGNIYAKNNEAIIVENSIDYLDDQWHHLALVMRRKGNTSMYFDGNLGSYLHSSNFGGFLGFQATVGASKHSSAVSPLPYSNHFTGSIDEVRIWKLARTTKLLNMDLNSKLQGDEKGLVAYYPFDKYDVNLILQPSLVDNDVNDVTDSLSTLVATNFGGTFDNINVPNIKDARPAQNLAFDWVVNNDKIIINITEPAALIEKRVIEFTVDRIEDLNQNRLASPETWTAYIKQNTVIWDQNELNFQIAQYDTLSFDVNILNIGGVEQDYTITNLPSWLTASTPVGTLAPASSKTITFAVSPGTNIGTYEEVLYLTTDFGYNEILFITLKVTGTTPDWSLDPNQYQYSMNIIGEIRVDSIVSTDPDDKLIATVNGEVRGVTNLNYYPSLDTYLAFMDVYSNAVGGDTVVFNIWDASKGKVHTEVTPNLVFASNALFGTPTSPQVFNAINTFYEPIIVRPGWNWLSFPLNSTKHSIVNNLLNDLVGTNGDIMKGISTYDQYSSSIGWVGSITSGGGVTNAETYKLNTSFDDTIKYVGSKVDPSTIKIAIENGWNWIGFVSQKNLAVADAFTNYIPSHGDLLKGQLAFAIYDTTLGWVGNLTYMKPKHGYMFKSAKVDTLIYPNAALFNYRLAVNEEQEIMNNAAALNPHNYQYTMNAIVSLDFCSDILTDVTLAAYAGKEIRGVSKVENGRAFITIYSNTATDKITFKAIGKNGETYPIDQNVIFKTDDIVGLTNNPMLLSSAISIEECNTLAEANNVINETIVASSSLSLEDKVQVTPTIFDAELKIKYTLEITGKVVIELYDITGRKLHTILNGERPKGANTITWQPNRFNLRAGQYFLKITLGNETEITEKIVKIN